MQRAGVPHRRQGRGCAGQQFDGRGVGLFGRLETGDRSPKHQLRVRGMGERPPNEGLRTGEQLGGRVVGVRHPLLGSGDNLTRERPAAPENGVVQRVLGVEIHIQRRRSHTYPAGDLAEAETARALLGHHSHRHVEDFVDGLLAPPVSPIRRRR